MNGMQIIARERRRQIEKEGWTDHNDDGYTTGQLESGAACYVQYAFLQAINRAPAPAVIPQIWPWHRSWWKPTTIRRNLAKAGALAAAALDRLLRETGDYTAMPEIVCLCGSTRFYRQFQLACLTFTVSGKIVLSIGAATATDEEHFARMTPADYEKVKADLDELHKRKIDLADRVYVINVDGYIGESTRSEIVHAIRTGKPVSSMEGIPGPLWAEFEMEASTPGGVPA